MSELMLGHADEGGGLWSDDRPSNLDEIAQVEGRSDIIL